MKLVDVDNFWEYDEIVDIEEVGDIETLDISVSGDNLFCANNILTHNSGFHTENPDMTTISESIGLCATADCITSIFQNDEDRELGVIRLGMMKNRYGARGTTQAMRIDYSTLSILQSDEDPVVSDNFSDSTFRILTSLSEA